MQKAGQLFDFINVLKTFRFSMIRPVGWQIRPRAGGIFCLGRQFLPRPPAGR